MKIVTAILTLCLSGCVMVSATVLPVSFGFEESEGFTPNSSVRTSGTRAAGWNFSADGVRTTNSANGEPVWQGDLALRVEVGKSASNRSIVSREDAYSMFSYSYINESNPYAQQRRMSWSYVYLWDESINNTRYIQLMTRYGDSAEQDYRVEYVMTNANGQGQHVSGRIHVAQELMDMANWNRVSMQFDFENKTFDLLLNGAKLTNGIALPDSWSLSALLGVDLYSIASGAGIVYYDGVEFAMIPEPAVYAGIFGLLLVIFIWRSRKSTGGQ